MKKKMNVPRNFDGSERECSTCHKLIYNKKEGCPDISCADYGKAIAKQFIIKDWTGREMDFGTFKTFDDASDCLINKFSDEDLQEYYIDEVTPCER